MSVPIESTPCDSCGKPMEAHSHFVVRIDVFADPEMPKTTSEEIAATDFDAELARVMEEMRHLSADELQDQVHRRFEFKICGACQRRFLANPLGKPRVVKQTQN